tara:strand:+ start:12549 stop:12869 length:321 start_codon:yes stop_codon:yes gene_type:complete
MNWKKISSDLVTQHSDTESAVVSLDPHSMGEIVNLSNEDFCLEVKGRELKAKKVRRFLWENRKKRALQRKNAVLWSAYMEDEDKSYVGVGALTTKRIADRMAKRNG